MTKKDHQPIPSWCFYTDQRARWTYWDRFLTPEECDKLIVDATNYNLSKAVTFDNNNVNSNNSYRDSEVTWIQPSQEFEWLYRRLTDVILDMNQKYFKFDIWGLTESLQFTKYVAPTGKYDEHVDCGFGSVIRKLSIVIQLSDENDYDGGNFEYIDCKDPEILPRRKGTLLIFPSFSLHRVSPVTRGTRYSLVGWVSGKPFV